MDSVTRRGLSVALRTSTATKARLRAQTPERIEKVSIPKACPPKMALLYASGAQRLSRISAQTRPSNSNEFPGAAGNPKYRG